MREYPLKLENGGIKLKGYIPRNGKLRQVEFIYYPKEKVVKKDGESITFEKPNRVLEAYLSGERLIVQADINGIANIVIPLFKLTRKRFYGLYVEMKNREVIAVHYAGKFEYLGDEADPLRLLAGYWELTPKEKVKIAENIKSDWVNVITSDRLRSSIIRRKLLIDPLFLNDVASEIVKKAFTDEPQLFRTLEMLAPPIRTHVYTILKKYGVIEGENENKILTIEDLREYIKTLTAEDVMKGLLEEAKFVSLPPEFELRQ